MIIKKIIFGLVIMLILSSCATLDSKDIPKENELIKPERFVPRLSYDIFQFRIDVDRNYIKQMKRITERSSRGNFDYSSKTKTEKSPYSYVGIYYGNGFFFDANRNLCIDVIKLLKLDELDYFKIVKDKNGFFDSSFECSKDGDVFFVSENEEMRAVLKDNVIKINDSKEVLTIGDEAINYRPDTILGNITQEKIQKEGNLVKLAGNYVYEIQTKSSYFNVGKDKHLYIDGEKIYYSRIGEEKNIFTVMRTKDGYVFIESENSGFTIKYFEDKIIIKSNGKETTYNIELEKEI